LIGLDTVTQAVSYFIAIMRQEFARGSAASFRGRSALDTLDTLERIQPNRDGSWLGLFRVTSIHSEKSAAAMMTVALS